MRARDAKAKAAGRSRSIGRSPRASPHGAAIALLASQLTQKIIACVAEVHQTLGPGFLESVYRNALVLRLRPQ